MNNNMNALQLNTLKSQLLEMVDTVDTLLKTVDNTTTTNDMYSHERIILQPPATVTGAGCWAWAFDELVTVIIKTIQETSAINWIFIFFLSFVTAFGIDIVAGVSISAITGGGTGFAMVVQTLLGFFVEVPLFALTLVVNLILLVLSAVKEKKYSFTGRSLVTILVINLMLALLTYLPFIYTDGIPSFIGVAVITLGCMVAFGRTVWSLAGKSTSEAGATVGEIKLRKRTRIIVDLILLPLTLTFSLFFTGIYHLAMLGIAAFCIGVGIGAINSVCHAKGATTTGGTDTLSNLLSNKFGGHPMLWMRGIDILILLLGALIITGSASVFSGAERFINSALLVIVYGVYAEVAKDIFVKIQKPKNSTVNCV